MTSNSDRDLMLIAVFTTMTVALWVFFELIQTTRTSTVSRPLQKAVRPMTSVINTEVLETLRTKQTYE